MCNPTTTTEALQGGEESSTLCQFSPEWDKMALNTAFQKSQSADKVLSNFINTEAGNDSQGCDSHLPPIGDTSDCNSLLTGEESHDGTQAELTKVTSSHMT